MLVVRSASVDDTVRHAHDGVVLRVERRRRRDLAHTLLLGRMLLAHLSLSLLGVVADSDLAEPILL